LEVWEIPVRYTALQVFTFTGRCEESEIRFVIKLGT
jgi:hypothetical protein